MDGKQRQIVNQYLIDDGHPTIINKRYIVTDSYPDYTCKSKLFLIDLENNNVQIIGRFYSPKKYQDDKRCDLHPRTDLDSNPSISIDSVCSGIRNIYRIDISKLIDN